jgi:hypothetical protein
LNHLSLLFLFDMDALLKKDENKLHVHRARATQPYAAQVPDAAVGVCGFMPSVPLGL